MAQQIRSGEDTEYAYGEWIAVESADGDIVYVWGCGCCSLVVTREKPTVKDDKWEVVET